MRILLLTAYSEHWRMPAFPLGLAYLASCLEEHQVMYLDMNVVEDPWSDLASAIADLQPQVIGISLRNIDTTQSHDAFSFFPSFVKLVQMVKSHKKNVTLIVGGSGFSLFPVGIMQRLPEIDFGINLEGEESFPELLDNLDNPSWVRGIYLRQNGQVAFTGPREPPDIDGLSFPRRDILDLSPYLKGPSHMGVQTKRGCCFKCIYCSYPLLSGDRVRVRSPRKVGEEIESLVRDYGVRQVFFVDSIFNFPPDHAKMICKEIIKRGLDVEWRANFHEKYLDSELVSLALQAGCSRLRLSPDGFNDASLEQLGKGMSLDELKATYSVIATIPQARFEAGFLFNYPGAAWTDILSLLALILKLKIKNNNFRHVHVSNIRIYPHTRMHRLAIEEGYIDPDADLLWPVFYDPFPQSIVSLFIRGFYRAARALIRLRRSIARR